MIVIEILSSAECENCSIAKRVIEEMVKGMEDVEVREINIIKNPEYAAKYQVMVTPAIVINDKLEFSGVPDEKKLLERLEEIRREDG